MTDIEADIQMLPERAKAWVRKNPDYWTDPAKAFQLQQLHKKLAGVPEFSDEYFNRLDALLKEQSA
jgi:hypothetical protein